MPLTAAIGAGIGAAGSIGSAFIGSNASKNAAQAQLTAQQQALQQQMTMFGTAQNALNPFISGGQSAVPLLQGLLTPGTSAATLAQMPGFAFASQYGTKAATNALAARGQGASAGPLATAVSQYNQGLASGQFQNIVGDLQGFANTGANAAGNLAGGAIASGNAQAGTLGNIGNAQASGILGSANAIGAGLTGTASAGQNALLYSQLFGGGNGGGLYSGAAYGGGNALTDAYGGSAANPLPGLTSADYG